MIKDLFCPRVAHRIQSNPYHAWLDEFAGYLQERGHPLASLHTYIFCSEHFTRWLGEQAPIPTIVDEDLVVQFLRTHLPICQCPKPAIKCQIPVRAALHHLLDALRRSGLIGASLSGPPSATEQALARYDAYLAETCGMAEETRAYRLRHARRFLAERFDLRPLRFELLTPSDLAEYVIRHAGTAKPGSVKVLASSLRSCLRFLALEGLCDGRLAKAVPGVPCWRLSSIPKTITEADVDSLLASFNRSNASGRRDYAIALCLVEYGFRTGETATLQLDDINWRDGAIRVADRKNRRQRILPLTDRVGEAIAAYLRAGRPASASRGLFLRHTTPVGHPVTKHIVRGIIRRGFSRCGIRPPADGPHVLRHTLATRLLESGIQMKEVADLLGHRSIETTAIYAKVNLPELRQVALPWPLEVR